MKLCVFFLPMIRIHRRFEVLINTCMTRLPMILTSFLVNCSKRFARSIAKRQDLHIRRQSMTVPSMLALRSHVLAMDGGILT